MHKKNILVLIPARFKSSRFPGKPLVPILGKPMIQWVYERVAAAGFTTYVVTDDARIEACVQEFQGKVVRVDDDVPSGTERIYLAYQRFFQNGHFDLIVNVQGDEPLFRAEVLTELAEFHLESSFELATVVRERSALEEDFLSAHVVKAQWVKKTGQCLTFSRASLPYCRDGHRDFSWFQHIGIYSFRPLALEQFCQSPMTFYEDLEKLEQMRALELGMKIGAIKTEFKFLGVDTPDDIKKVEEALK